MPHNLAGVDSPLLSGDCLLRAALSSLVRLGRGGAVRGKVAPMDEGMHEPSSAPSAGAADGGLRRRLRADTAQAHAELETALDLLGRASDRRRFVRVLERFLGFHMIWERSIRQRPALRAFYEPRSRLPHLRRDLAALGLTNAEQAALPKCGEAASLVADEAEAIGSIYVLEGSTLGGQVISRALEGAVWAPPGGLAYFDPYPGRTGDMWRKFGAWAEANTPEHRHAAATAGANRTFGLLQEWLTA
jgi:heme oxygenase